MKLSHANMSSSCSFIYEYVSVYTWYIDNTISNQRTVEKLKLLSGRVDIFNPTSVKWCTVWP